MEETKTKYPGIYRIDRGYRVRAYAKDPYTGKMKEVVKTLQGITLQEALKVRIRLHQELLAPQEPKSERLTLTAYAQRWLEEHARRDRFATLDTRVRTLESHVLPALGHVYLDELTPLMLKDWLTQMAQKRKPRGPRFAASTVNGWLRVLKAVMRSAIVDLDLARDPTLGVRALPDGGYSDEGGNVLTAQEVTRFLSEAHTHFPEQYPMILIGLTTGMRFGELSALHWDDISFDQGVIVVRRSQVRGRVSPPKSGKLRRVPVPRKAIDVLRDLRSSRSDAPTNGPVFPTAVGGYHSVTFLAKPFKRLRELTKIDRRFTPHGMRRTFNTLMIEAGVDRVVLRATIGHSSERMTEHYAFVGDAAKKRATDQVTRLLQFPLGSYSGPDEPAIA